MFDVALTADRTLMNRFHLKNNFATSFYGSADSLPYWLFRIMAGEPKKDGSGNIQFAPYPLRKIASKIVESGYDTITISPGDLPKYIKKTSVLGVHTVDPLGLATTPGLREVMINRIPYSVHYFRNIFENKAVQGAKKDGLKIIVGGAGAWQFGKYPHYQEKLGIDCVLIGEGENVISDIIKKALEGDRLPRLIKCGKKQIPNISDIPVIKEASNFGCVEIGRGCVRGCKFCDVTKGNLRWLPLNHIEKELKINANAGITQGLLHSEDCLLYGQKGVIPGVNKLANLIRLAKKYYQKFHFTHLSLSAVSAKPDIIPATMELILEDQDFMLGEAGIETGSIRLLSSTMSGKIRPFKKERWTEIIHNSLGILHDHSFIPYCSFIYGLPGEREEDILKTLDLVDDLKGYRSIFLPGNFTPLGKYRNMKGYNKGITDLDEPYKELLRKCIVHNIKWINDIRYKLFHDSRYKMLLHMVTKVWMRQYKRRAKKYGLFDL